MEAVKGNLGTPPRILSKGRVLEYIVFDEYVKRSSSPLFTSTPFALTLPIEGLAICQSTRRSSPATLMLCFCSSAWEVDSEQVWNSDSGPKAESIDPLKSSANELFENLGNDWVHVGNYKVPAKKWWQFWG